MIKTLAENGEKTELNSNSFSGFSHWLRLKTICKRKSTHKKAQQWKKHNNHQRSYKKCWNKWQKYSMILCLYSKLFKCFDFNFYFMSFLCLENFFCARAHTLPQNFLACSTFATTKIAGKMENNANQNKNTNICI